MLAYLAGVCPQLLLEGPQCTQFQHLGSQYPKGIRHAYDTKENNLHNAPQIGQKLSP
jgi:hypothetical protein